MDLLSLDYRPSPRRYSDGTVQSVRSACAYYLRPESMKDVSHVVHIHHQHWSFAAHVPASIHSLYKFVLVDRCRLYILLYCCSCRWLRLLVIADDLTLVAETVEDVVRGLSIIDKMMTKWELQINQGNGSRIRSCMQCFSEGWKRLRKGNKMKYMSRSNVQ